MEKILFAFKLVILSTALIGSPLAEQKTFKFGDTFEISAPMRYSQHAPFQISVSVLKLNEEKQNLYVSANYIKSSGKFGGPLQHFKTDIAVLETGKKMIDLTIKKTKPDLGLALLTIYLSPDGKWKTRTAQAVIPLLPENGNIELYKKQVINSQKQNGTVPNNKQNTSIEEYIPKDEYFTQRKDNPDLRKWKITKQAMPDLQSIINTPAEDRSPVGIYMWPEEFVKAIDPIKDIGFKTIRLSGPWADADEAFRLAAENDIEVLYTLQIGRIWKDYRKLRRPHYESDEAFLQAFVQNVQDFLKRYGPGGSLYMNTELKSPLAVVEMWNEPNFFYMIPDQKPKEKTQQRREALYPKVLIAGYNAAKTICPDILVAGVAGGGAASADIRFIKNIFKNQPDLGSYMDILTTHPYNQGAPPETQKIQKWGTYSIMNNLSIIQKVQKQYNTNKPIWYSELGWSIHHSHGGQFASSKGKPDQLNTPDMVGAYIARMYILSLRLGIPRIQVMHLHDSDGYNAGFIHRKTMKWRPAAHATKNLIKLLPFPKLLSAQSDGEANNYIYHIRSNHKVSNSKEFIVAWNSLGPKEAKIKVSAKEVTVYDMVGNQKNLLTNNGSLSIELGPYPIYITK